MLKLGLPSKGRLQAQVIDAFAAHGITVARTGDEREYAGQVAGVEGIQLVLLSAGEVPRALAEGQLHLGVTGEDMIRERIAEPEGRVAILKRLDFGHADLIVAVPSVWIDVETMHDLDEVAADFRTIHGHPLRVATKYHNLARAFFALKGVADYRLVDSQGATEAAPKNRTAEALVDITSSGATLKANHLKILDDGLILRSEAVLAASRAANWSASAHAALAGLGERLGFAAPVL
jgi:ATP phosphoribosyltransferase